MKKVRSAFCFCIVLMLLAVAGMVTVSAANPIDPEKESSLTLQYRHGGVSYSGLQVECYRVASVAADGTYTLIGDFAAYPVNIYGVVSQAEWKQIASTLSSYIAADNLVPTCTGTTDASGTVAFKGLKPGMYLTMGTEKKTASEKVTFETFLTVVPYPVETGEHNYHGKANPKSQRQIIEPEEVSYKVVKQWNDNGDKTKRPSSVTVDLYKDGKLQSTQELSSANNWSYSWTDTDNGSVWKAVERNIPDGYTVSIVEKDNTFLITNACEGEEPPLPQTGDTTILWPYILAAGLSGGAILVIAVWRLRSGK